MFFSFKNSSPCFVSKYHKVCSLRISQPWECGCVEKEAKGKEGILLLSESIFGMLEL
jgi:hypothetical protein